MKCARLHLQQRVKGNSRSGSSASIEKPRRYCQKRLVNPDHEEDPRWMDLFDRFHCNMNSEPPEPPDSAQAQQEPEDMVLTVQTLQFQGDVDQTKLPRTSFKYKKITDGIKHRMFVKQPITDNELSDDDRSSQLTYYYFDDYLKYLHSTDRSRPTSSKSSVFLNGYNKAKENKSTQVEFTKADETKKLSQTKNEIKKNVIKNSKREIKDEIRELETIENTKITYKKAGKRKSLTISRTQSPETVQVIRVDVVCNYNASPSPNFEEIKQVDRSPERSEINLENVDIKNKYFLNKYTNHFANKYLLTNTIKTLEENLSGGEKVTLLCKTFKLSDRVNTTDRNSEMDRKFTKTPKTKKEKKAKNKSNSKRSTMIEDYL